MKNRKLTVLIPFLFYTTLVYAQIELRVAPVFQDDASWCWAATAKMIFDYHGNPSINRQCDIVQTHFGSSAACTCPVNCSNTSNCAIGLWNEELVNLMRTYNYNWTVQSSLNWGRSKTLLNGYKPFILAHEVVRKGVPCLPSHYLTARGWCEPKTTCKFLIVNDPGACKNQITLAIRVGNSNSLRICQTIEDSNTDPKPYNKSKKLDNDTTCKLIVCKLPKQEGTKPKMRMYQKKQMKSVPIFDDIIKPIVVNYFEIENNKLVRINQNPFYDFPKKIDTESDDYLIYRAEEIDGELETQMVMKGRFLNNLLVPEVSIDGIDFTLEGSPYSKVILLPYYEDFIRFYYKKRKTWYYYPLNNCKDCKPKLCDEKQLIDYCSKRKFETENNILKLKGTKK